MERFALAETARPGRVGSQASRSGASSDKQTETCLLAFAQTRILSCVEVGLKPRIAIAWRESSMFLEQAGYKVVVASNGADAMKAAEDRPNAPDLLLTDVALPQIRGTELARRLLERHPRLRVLYMSGFSEETVSAGTLHFITEAFQTRDIDFENTRSPRFVRRPGTDETSFPEAAGKNNPPTCRIPYCRIPCKQTGFFEGL